MVQLDIDGAEEPCVDESSTGVDYQVFGNCARAVAAFFVVSVYLSSFANPAHLAGIDGYELQPWTRGMSRHVSQDFFVTFCKSSRCTEPSLR
jgi:hypothetical protein